MSKKLFIVTAVDISETTDGKARVLDVCKTKEEAAAVVRAAIERWADERAGMPIVVDFDKMSAKYDWKTLDDTDGCEWNISEHDLDTKED